MSSVKIRVDWELLHALDQRSLELCRYKPRIGQNVPFKVSYSDEVNAVYDHKLSKGLRILCDCFATALGRVEKKGYVAQNYNPDQFVRKATLCLHRYGINRNNSPNLMKRIDNELRQLAAL